jgi:hypothetical protein
MTTMAAIFGIRPIAIGIGAGPELRQPLGVAVVGGIVLSQALTLFTIPVTYVYMERLSEWIARFGRPTRRPRDLASNHALVPAGDYPRPAIIHHRAAEGVIFTQTGSRARLSGAIVRSEPQASPPLPQPLAVAVPRDNRGESLFRDARLAHGNCPPAGRRTPCRTGAPSMYAPLARALARVMPGAPARAWPTSARRRFYAFHRALRNVRLIRHCPVRGSSPSASGATPW